MSKNSFENSGLRFQCQGSGGCCTSRGEYGFVYMTLGDRKKMALHLGLRTSDFTRQYCDKTGGVYHLKTLDQSDCMFLKNKRCEVYPSRPTQCRTWPFWPENMNAKTWNNEVATYCPGIGKGPKVPLEEIQALLQQERKAEAELFGYEE